MGERRLLVVGSQCEAANRRLSFLPHAAEELAEVLLDPAIGCCVPALPDDRDLLIDPTSDELDDAVTEAFEHAAEDEATLFLALIGHGDYADDDFYFLTRDTRLPVDSRRSFLLAQRVKELLGRHSMLDGLVILLDTCHAGIGVRQAAANWVTIVGEAGKRFDVLTASDHRPAADGCFSRSLTRVLRDGRPELGEHVRCSDLKRVVSTLCPHQTAVYLAFDGVRPVAKGDQGLWLAVNAADSWHRSPLAGSPAASLVERLVEQHQELLPVRKQVVAKLLAGIPIVPLSDGTPSERSAVVAGLIDPAAAGTVVPRGFLAAALLPIPGWTDEQLAAELGRQLSRSLPGFDAAVKRCAAEGDLDRMSAFEQAVLGPLRLFAPSHTDDIRLAVDGHDSATGRHRETLLDWALALTTVPGVQLVVTTEWPRLGPSADAVQVRQTQAPGVVAGRVGFGSSWRNQPRDPAGRWTTEPERHLLVRWIVLGLALAGTITGVVAVQPPIWVYLLLTAVAVFPFILRSLHRRSAKLEDLDLGELPEPEVDLDDLLAVAVAPVPLGILAAAAGLRVPEVRELLVRAGDLVERIHPGEHEESARAAHTLAVPSPTAHAVMADAIARVVPAGPGRTPEQEYATAHEAEHLWEARRHADAVRSLELRPLGTVIGNRDRWYAYVRSATLELGAAHPLTVRCQENHRWWAARVHHSIGPPDFRAQ